MATRLLPFTEFWLQGQSRKKGGALAALFSSLGWRQEPEQPQLIIINTRTVTAVADKKARNLIRRLRREHPQAVLAVCGCYAQRDAAEYRGRYRRSGYHLPGSMNGVSYHGWLKLIAGSGIIMMLATTIRW